MSVSSDAENLASELHSSCSLGPPGALTKASRSRQQDRAPLKVSNLGQFTHGWIPVSSPGERKEVLASSVENCPVKLGNASINQGSRVECQGNCQTKSDHGAGVNYHDSQNTSECYRCSAMLMSGHESNAVVMDLGNAGKQDHNVLWPSSCMNEVGCGNANQLGKWKAEDVETLGSIEKYVGTSDGGSLEGKRGFNEDVWAAIAGPNLSLTSAKAATSPAWKHADLIKARALSQHFQKLKGELVDALGNDSDAGWPKGQSESSANYHDFLGQNAEDGKKEIKLSKLLCEQLKILAEREKAVERRLSMERMEHIVEKVEEEVELEAAMEELLLRMKADEEVMEMQRQDREWEIQRREVQYEEEILMLKNKVRRLEEELSVTQAEKEYALQKKQDEMDEVIRGMLVELREGEEDLTRGKDASKRSTSAVDLIQVNMAKERLQKQVDSPSKDLFIAFEDMLKEADERTEKERKYVEELTITKEEGEEQFQHERRRWREKDKQTEYRVLALEKEVGRMSVVLRESETALKSERERRKEARLELERTMDILRAESKSHHLNSEKLRRLESFLRKVKRRLENVLQWASTMDGGQDIQRSLLELLDDPDLTITETPIEVSTASEGDADFQYSVVAQLSQSKVDRDRLEGERDTLEEKLTMLLQKARDKEKEIEGIWLEKEKLLIAKLSNLEAKSEDWELKYSRRESAFFQEQKKWQQEMEAWKKKWVKEKHGWEAMLGERELWVEGQVEKWSCVLEEKEAELTFLRSELKELAETLETNRQRMEDMKQQMVISRKGLQEGFKVVPAGNRLEDSEESCNSSEVGASLDALVRHNESQSKNFIDVEQLAIEMEADIRRMTDEIRLKEDRLEMEKLEMRSEIEQLHQARQDLEQKVAQTLHLMETLKSEAEAKEVQMETERQQMEEVIRTKDSEIKKLESQLDFREHEMDLGVHKFREEVRLLDREIERERKSKEQEIELNHASQQRLWGQMKEKEEMWSKKMSSLAQQLDKIQAELDQKISEFKRFEEEAVRREAQLEHEKRRWIELAKSEELKMAKAISNLMNEKSELFESSQREQKEHQQTVDKLMTEVLALRESVEKQKEELDKGNSGTEAGLMKPVLETLWMDYSENRANVDKRAMEWESAVERVADFDKQISEAMLAIQSLREELSMKENALVQARLDREAEWDRRETSWAQERLETAKTLEQFREIERQSANELERREVEFSKERKELLRLLAVEREESGNAISVLQGAVKELEWSLKHDKHADSPNLPKVGRSTEMVKVHASHLEEVDSFVRALKLKVEELENQYKAAEAALRALEMEKATRDADVDAALLQMEKDFTKISPDNGGRPVFPPPFQDRGVSSPASMDGGFENFRKRARASLHMGVSVAKPSDRRTLLMTNGLCSSQQDAPWTACPSEQLSRFIEMDAASSVTSTSNTWLTRQGNAEDSWISEQERMPHALNSGPAHRRQQKWLVDAGWLERVRKEQTFLRQQLEFEKQRAASVEQVEAENRWLETAIARALEQKKESDSKVQELQQQVVRLESVLADSGMPEATPPRQ